LNARPTGRVTFLTVLEIPRVSPPSENPVSPLLSM
jgi:hypothetical protein